MNIAHLHSKQSASTLFITAFILPLLYITSCTTTSPPPPSSTATNARWFVACAPSLKTTLTPLANHRQSQGRQIIWITANNPDSLAKQLAQHNAGQKDGDTLLLVGTPAGWRGSTQPSAFGTTGRMTGKPTDASLSLYHQTSRNLAIGRLPARNTAELKTMIQKIIGYEKPDPNQLTAVTLVANPMAGSDSMWLADKLIGYLSKKEIRRIGNHWKVTGAADVQGHPFQVPSSKFREASLDAIQAPYHLLAFFGHSDQTVLVSKTSIALLASDWDDLPRSYSHGLFFTCGCLALADQDAYGVRAMRAPGGPIATIGAVGTSNAAFGYLAGKGIVDTTRTRTPTTLGDWWLQVQNQISNGKISRTLFVLFDRVDGSGGKVPLKTQRLEHLEMWQLYGDPAMPFPPPRSL